MRSRRLPRAALLACHEELGQHGLEEIRSQRVPRGVPVPFAVVAGSAGLGLGFEPREGVSDPNAQGANHIHQMPVQLGPGVGASTGLPMLREKVLEARGLGLNRCGDHEHHEIGAELATTSDERREGLAGPRKGLGDHRRGCDHETPIEHEVRGYEGGDDTELHQRPLDGR